MQRHGTALPPFAFALLAWGLLCALPAWPAAAEDPSAASAGPPVAAPWDTRPSDGALPPVDAPGDWEPPAIEVPGAAPDLPAIDREIEEVATLVEGAHFHTALAVAQGTRELLGNAGAGAETNTRRVRLEVLAATAAIALDRPDEAIVYMRSALDANPNLQLDENTTSPKVIGLLQAVRDDLGNASLPDDFEQGASRP